MAKKNLPNIPIYIGDWDRDCNILSLETEMAWMKIIFKMHLNGKQSTYKTSTKGLQILWKSEQSKVNEIIDELLFNEICGIEVIKGGYVFTSRRFEKENEISKIRSKAVKNRYSKDDKTTNDLQNSYKDLQSTDIDYENESEYDNIKIKKVEKLKLVEKYGLDAYQWFIHKLSNYKLSNGKTYKSDYGAINSWVVKDWEKNKVKKEKLTSSEALSLKVVGN